MFEVLNKVISRGYDLRIRWRAYPRLAREFYGEVNFINHDTQEKVAKLDFSIEPGGIVFPLATALQSLALGLKIDEDKHEITLKEQEPKPAQLDPQNKLGAYFDKPDYARILAGSGEFLARYQAGQVHVSVIENERASTSANSRVMYGTTRECKEGQGKDLESAVAHAWTKFELTMLGKPRVLAIGD